MPIINGIKMACEPCIRGHRSTKCNHANERVMLPVRKPGRPLSICPHPPNNNCSCASVTAAIPRSHKCGCGAKPAPSSTTKTPRSPSKRSFFKPPTSPKSLPRSRIDPSALGRTDVSQMNIHAPPSGWSNGNPPPSIDDISIPGGHQNGGPFMMPGESMPFFPGQDEPSAIFPPTSGPYQHNYQIPGPGGEHMYANGHSEFNSFFDNGMDISTPLGEMPLPETGLENFGLNMNQSAPAYSTHPRASQMNGFHGLQFQPPPPHSSSPNTMTPVATAAPPAATTAKPSCCAPAAQQPASTESSRHTPTSSTTSVTSNAGTANSKSCCSPSPVSSSSSASQHTMLKSESIGGGHKPVSLSSIPLVSRGDVKPPTGANGHVLGDQYSVSQMDPSTASGAALLHSASLGQQVYPGFAQQEHGSPAWYRYGPEYGTVTAPLQPSQWRTSLTVTAGPNAGMFNENMQQQQQHHQHPQQQQQQEYGSATIQPTFSVHNGTVDDADLHMCSCGDDCECIGCVAHPYNNATRNTVQSVWSMMDDSSSTTSSTRTATAPTAVPAHQLASSSVADSTTSPPQIPTPSDTSGVSDDQVSLPSGDFLFVSYSVMGCDGEGLTCPCGDDCQCVGCTIHNNAPM